MISDRIVALVDDELPNFGAELIGVDFEVSLQPAMNPANGQIVGVVALFVFMAASPILGTAPMFHVHSAQLPIALERDGVREIVMAAVQNLRDTKARLLLTTNGHQA